jgi:CTP synthase (UTP-ammonia lyase)
VLGIREGDHEETSPQATILLISRLECVIAGRIRPVRLTAGTITAAAYGRDEAIEQFRCSFGLNPSYRDEILKEPLRVAGVDENGEVRIVELGGHPFFIATLFLPQLSSELSKPHSLILAYLRSPPICTLGSVLRCNQTF